METARHPFFYRDYRLYWAGRLMSTIASLCMVIVIGWQAYDIARRTMGVERAAFQLGWIGVAQFLPLLLLTLVTGWTADRVDRRWIARATALLEIGCAATLGLMAWHHSTTLPALFAIAALLGVARAFAGPALGALAPNLVPAATLPTAIALGSIAWQGGSVVGPALGGYLYALADWVPYAVSTALFSGTLLCLLGLRPLPPRARAAGVNPWAQMVEGLHYVRRNRLVLGAISLDLFAVLLGGATAMLPVYARDVLHVNAAGLGDLRAAPALGSALTALLFTLRPLRRDVGVKLLGAVAVFGMATVGFGLSRSMPLSLACLALLGAADMVSVYVRQSLIQLWTPDAMRGRVGAVSSLFISGSNELGEAESGFLAALIGPVPAVVAGGIGAILVALLWSRWFPEIRKARDFTPPPRLDEYDLKEKAA
ncbi:MFS transporter [Sphingomonas morindae]|uniref:MFS transporter n=1 Tax=Sphingomonas morindae TaxID=1541170 RepID=A0ABY4X5K0_9SPHN|nr:MFS transporter [Sphingomonas morindae]USI72173.1 MFS transporter [Sphingomonas morindae]